MLENKKVILLKAGAKNKGGLEKYTTRIAQAFVEKGAQVTCLSTGETPHLIAGVQFHSFPIRSPFSFRKIELFDHAVKNFITKNRADIVLGLDRNRQQTHIRAGNGVHAAFLKSRIPTEGKLKYYSSLLNPLHRKILSIEKEACLDPCLKKIFTNSRMVAKELQEHYSVDSAKIEVIHNGVEWKEMESPFNSWQQAKECFLKERNLPRDRFHLIFIGHGYLRKGLDVLLKALKQWKFKDFHLSIVGKEKRLDRYITEVKKLQMEHQVRFFGPQMSTTPFYQLADALVIPSFYDPFANVTVEALSMGVFVVSSQTNGGHEILTSKNGSVIQDLLSTESILETLEIALKNKKTLQRALEIRNSISHLDFSHQLTQLIESCE